MLEFFGEHVLCARSSGLDRFNSLGGYGGIVCSLYHLSTSREIEIVRHTKQRMTRFKIQLPLLSMGCCCRHSLG